MIIARQSTARIVTVGPVLDADGVAVTTAAVGDFKISKNGGAPAALNGSATLTHRHTGHYSLSLTASDLDTVGSAEVVIDKTTDVCPPKVLTVIEEAVYDALFAAAADGKLPATLAAVDVSGNLPSNLTQWKGAAPADLTDTDKVQVSLQHNVPANFAALGINGSGHISRVVLVDTTTANTDMRGTDNAALAATALSTAQWTNDRAGYLDKLNVSGTLAHSDAANTYKADVSGLSTFDHTSDVVAANANLIAVLGTALTESDAGYVAGAVSHFFDVATPAKTVNDVGGGEGGGDSASTIYTYFTAESRADAFKADVSGLSTLDAAGVRTAVGLASANLDDQLLGVRPYLTGTAQGGSTTTITLAADAPSLSNLLNGWWIVLTGGDSPHVARRIRTYNGSTKVATVAGGFFNPVPDSSTTYAIFRDADVNVGVWRDDVPGALVSASVPSAVLAMGTNAITAAAIASDAITSAKIANNAITAAKINDGALTAAKFASGAFDAVWSVSTRTLTSLGSLLDSVTAALASLLGYAARVDGLIEDDGAENDRFTAKALEQAPSGDISGATDWDNEQRTFILDQLTKIDDIEGGGGGGGPVIITPVFHTAGPGEVTAGQFTAYIGAAGSVNLYHTDAAGEPIDLSGEELVFVVEHARSRQDKFVKSTEAEDFAGGDGFTNVSWNADDFCRPGVWSYALRLASSDPALTGRVWARGTVAVEWAAQADPD